MASSNQIFSRLAWWAFILAFIVIILGAYTRLTNAGLSCPDWPRCYGYFTPPTTADELQTANKAYPQAPVDKAKAWTEMRHRYLAGIEGIIILSMIFLSWYQKKYLSPGVFKLSQSLFFIMAGQIVLGMLTVTALLKPVIVLGHLLFGFSIISILWLLWLLTKRQKPKYPQDSFAQQQLNPWINIGLVILIIQITLGGWVSTHAAGLACIDFPYCNGVFFPRLKMHDINNDIITMHMLHRIGAIINFLYLSLLGFLLFFKNIKKGFAITLLLLLTAQMILGILNILWLRPIPIALSHHAIAACLLLTLLAIRAHLSSEASLQKVNHHD